MQNILKVLLLVTLVSPLYAQWIGIGTLLNGNWNDALHWTGGIPTTSADILAIGDFTVTVTQTTSLTGALTLGGVLNSFPTLLVQAGQTFTCGSLALRSGSIILQQGATLTTNTFSVTSGAFQSTVVTVSGNLVVTGTTTVDSSSTLIYNGTATLNNTVNLAGTLAFQGTTTFSSAARITGAGSVRVNGATLNFGSDTTITNSVAIQGQATFNAAAQTLTSLTLSGATTVQGDLNIQGNTRLIAQTATMTSGSITSTASSSFRVAGTLTVNAATNAMVTISGAFDNAGTVAVTSGSLVFQGANRVEGTINVAANARVQFSGQQTISSASSIAGSGMVAIQDNAQLIVESSATIAANTQFSASSEISATSGNTRTLSLSGSATFGASANDVVMIHDNVAVLIDGIATHSNGAIELSENAALHINGELHCTGSSNQIRGNGTFLILATGHLFFSQNTNSHYDIFAKFQTDGNVTSENGAEIVVHGDAVCHPTSDIFLGATGHGGKLTFTGTFDTYCVRLAHGDGTMSVSSESTRTYTLEAVTYAFGKLEVAGQSTVQFAGEATVQGQVTVGGSANLMIQHATTVQNEVQVTGQSTLTMSGAALTCAALTIESGSTYAVHATQDTAAQAILTASGAATLDGSINVVLDAGFSIDVGSEVAVLHYASHTGAFASLSVNNGAKRSTDEYSMRYDDNVAVVVRASTTHTSGAQSIVASIFVVLAALLVAF